MLEDGRLLIAVADRPAPLQLVELEASLDRKVALCLTTRSELALALRLTYGVKEPVLAPADSEAGDILDDARGYRRLGDILLDEEIVSSATLDSAVEGYATAQPQLFGEYLLRIGAITPEQLRLALELQSTCGARDSNPDQIGAAAFSPPGRRECQ
jgi:hypothetical protein